MTALKYVQKYVQTCEFHNKEKIVTGYSYVSQIYSHKLLFMVWFS